MKIIELQDGDTLDNHVIVNDQLVKLNYIFYFWTDRTNHLNKSTFWNMIFFICTHTHTWFRPSLSGHSVKSPDWCRQHELEPVAARLSGLFPYFGERLLFKEATWDARQHGLSRPTESFSCCWLITSRRGSRTPEVGIPAGPWGRGEEGGGDPLLEHPQALTET